MGTPGLPGTADSAGFSICEDIAHELGIVSSVILKDDCPKNPSKKT